MAEAHETPEFRNAVEYTVATTFIVAGGARQGTAERRARKVAERLTAVAARTAQVVEVTARGGVSDRGEISWPSPVRFDGANSGRGTHAEPDHLTRYLAPEHERALQSLAAANAAYRDRQRADEARRAAVGCSNANRTRLSPARSCDCVYCEPEEHAADARLDEPDGDNPYRVYHCLCGATVPAPASRCLAHRNVVLVVLDGDPGVLSVLAERDHARQRPRPSPLFEGRKQRAAPDRTDDDFGIEQ